MDWINFFEYLTAAAAAILGLSFVAFATSPRYWAENGLKHMAAVVSLVELAIPLFFGLMYLPPGHHWMTAGRVVGILGYAAIALQLGVAEWYRRKNYKFELVDKVQIFVGVPMVATTFSFMLWWPSLAVKAYTCVWLIFSGFSEAWLSLHQPGTGLGTSVPEVPKHERK